MEVIGWIVGGFFLLLVIAASVGAFFLEVGAKVAHIPGVTFGKAMAANLIGAIISTIAGLALGSIPVLGLILGPVGNIVGYILVVQHYFQTRFGPAAIAWLIAMIAQTLVAVVVVVVLMAVFGVSLLQFSDLLQTMGHQGM